jgi:hypothetical protein
MRYLYGIIFLKVKIYNGKFKSPPQDFWKTAKKFDTHRINNFLDVRPYIFSLS